ncbi:MAG TPA: hypothetical protein VFN67_28450 [Polyangiales bacterium]|nr:hypothetical protein [Polyangiales bacterium]
MLAPDAYDPPSVWALKLRALEADGALDEARSGLGLVPAERLRALPCDRDFLGSLGGLVRVALRLGARDYVEVLYELLSPYPEYFAVNMSGACEGSVSLLLGRMARFIGHTQLAAKHFDDAVLFSESAKMTRCAVEARAERGSAAVEMASAYVSQ